MLYIKVTNLVGRDCRLTPTCITIDFEGSAPVKKLAYEEALCSLSNAELLEYLNMSDIFQPDEIQIISESEYLKLMSSNESAAN